jgi:ribosomal protein S18 acetylase RimI-like enzyme
MAKIEEINEKSQPLIITSLKSDIIKHVFAIYDIQNDPQHTTTYAAFENANLRGYILIYTATDVPSVILECEDDFAERLLEHAPPSNFIVHAPPNLLPAIKKRFPDARHYLEDWMLVKKNEARFFKSELVRRLRTEEDALKLADLLLSRKDRPASTLRKYADWISKMPIYGLFREDQLVSYAGSFIKLPQVWLIGGVYTQSEHRNRGYATLVTSAITEEALKTAEAAALFARSDNYPAIKAYERISYRKIGEKVWVDVGTGLKP